MTEPKPLRPLLAAKFDEGELLPQLEKLSYPMIASPKLDGIRVLVHPTLGVITRTLKPIPNKYIQETFGDYPELNYLDGELVVGAPEAAGLFNQTQSAVMTQSGAPDFTYYVFDEFHSKASYDLRLHFVRDQTIRFQQKYNLDFVRALEHKTVGTSKEVLEYEATCLEKGYEGVMLRNPKGPYKYGRSTLKEQTLIKLKRMEDAEATIVGFEPLSRNNNPQERDALGLSKRSSHKAGKTPDELLGKLWVRNDRWGDFCVGSGFDVATREAIWLNQPQYLGRTICFRYQPTGIKELPRFPIFKGFRED